MSSPQDLNNSFFAGRKTLVTGAGGHLGSQLVARMLDRKAQVSIILKPSTDPWRLKKTLGQVKCIYADVQDLNVEDLGKEISTVDTFFHLAAVGVNPQRTNALDMMKANAIGTLNVLNLAKQLKVRRFIYCGSCSEYGPGEHLGEDVWPAPDSEYGASKVMGWVLANAFFRRYGLPVVSLRLFTLYGPWQSPYRLIAQVIDSVHNGKDIPLTSGEQKRDFIFIDDAVDAFLRAAMAGGIEGETFNVASGQAVTVRDVVAVVLRLMRARGVVPQWGALANRLDEIGIISGNPDKTKALLNWQARTGLEQGLRKTIDWAHEHKRTAA